MAPGWKDARRSCDGAAKPTNPEGHCRNDEAPPHLIPMITQAYSQP